MVIKIVTDSTADLPATLIKELGVAIVPEYLRFGDQVYRDHVDINEDEFYQRLLNGPVHPKTTQPTPQDFANVYSTLSQEADGIISIHLSSKLSGTYNSAVQGKSGKIYVKGREKAAIPYWNDAGISEHLWSVTESLINGISVSK